MSFPRHAPAGALDGDGDAARAALLQLGQPHQGGVVAAVPADGKWSSRGRNDAESGLTERDDGDDLPDDLLTPPLQLRARHQRSCSQSHLVPSCTHYSADAKLKCKTHLPGWGLALALQ